MPDLPNTDNFPAAPRRHADNADLAFSKMKHALTLSALVLSPRDEAGGFVTHFSGEAVLLGGGG